MDLIHPAGPKACQPEMHRHYPACAKYSRDDVPTYQTKTASGAWPPLCSACHLQVLRVRALALPVRGACE